MRSLLKKTLHPTLLRWFEHHGRKNLPWQQLGTPYPIWVSEIMLQQTQVKTVIPYYERFVSHFPTLESLANAPIDTVLQFWSGLGYYARARNLHQAAQIVLSKYKGIFPNTFDKIVSLPGIGRSTAGAILSFGFHKPYPILDGNIKRVLTRLAGITGEIGKMATLKQLWEIAEQLTPKKHTALYNQAMMDIGALVCHKANPNCSNCPLQTQCDAFQNNLQNQIPTPSSQRQRKKGSKKTLFLLCCHKDQILLEKRPPSGIWGGLWSFPELAPLDNLQPKDVATPWLKKNKLLNAVRSYTVWSHFVHTFTHFELEITPIQVIITGSLNNLSPASRDLAWFELQEAASLGLPSPSRRLIQRLRREYL